ncbi:MAG: hypothetical protein ACOC33_04070 [bacterium]
MKNNTKLYIDNRIWRSVFVFIKESIERSCKNSVHNSSCKLINNSFTNPIRFSVYDSVMVSVVIKLLIYSKKDLQNE